MTSEEGTTTHIIKTSKPSFKKKGGSLFKSSAGTNSRINNTTNAIAQKISVAKEQETFAGVDDANKGKKRSNDVAYGTWVPKKEVKKEEFDNDLGVSQNYYVRNFIKIFLFSYQNSPMPFSKKKQMIKQTIKVLHIKMIDFKWAVRQKCRPNH